MNNIKFESYLVGGMIGLTVISGALASSILVNADDITDITDTASVTVPTSCSMTATIDSEHSATIPNGIYSGTELYPNGIGKTTIATFCNDNSGYAIYAIGYTGDKYDGEDHTKLIGATSGQKISTGTATSGSASNWAMKLTKVADSTVSYNPENLTITNGYDDYNVIPDTYTKVANYTSTTDQTLGSVLSTTYSAYISPTEVADTYTGKVKYTLVHPNTEVPSQPQTTASSKICYYANVSDYEGTMGCQNVSSSVTLLASNFSRTGYGFAGWSDAFDYKTNTNAHFYGPQETITLNTADYTGEGKGLSLYAVWVKSEGNLQDTTKVASVCSNLTTAPTNGAANLASVSAFTDQRDNNTYAIAKLADNKCWMIENLRLDNTATLTLANTNSPLNDGANVTLKHNYSDTDTYNTLSPSQDPTATAWCNSNAAFCNDQSMLFTGNTTNRKTDSADNDDNIYSYGNYYNWYSATAGRGTFSFGTDNNSVAGDLCPSGWHLPKGGSSANATNSDFWQLGLGIMGAAPSDNNYYQNSQTNAAGKTATAAFRSYPNNFVYSGYVSSGSVSDRGSNGNYWSSTARSSSRAYFLELYSYDVGPGTSSVRYGGWSVRCVAPGA